MVDAESEHFEDHLAARLWENLIPQSDTKEFKLLNLGLTLVCTACPCRDQRRAKPPNNRDLTAVAFRGIDRQYAPGNSRSGNRVWHADWLGNTRNNALRIRLFDGRYEGC